MKTYGQISNKAYGQIYSEARDAFYEEHRKYGIDFTTLTRASSEAGAQAVIEEFKRRHNIVIPPEED